MSYKNKDNYGDAKVQVGRLFLPNVCRVSDATSPAPLQATGGRRSPYQTCPANKKQHAWFQVGIAEREKRRTIPIYSKTYRAAGNDQINSSGCSSPRWQQPNISAPHRENNECFTSIPRCVPAHTSGAFLHYKYIPARSCKSVVQHLVPIRCCYHHHPVVVGVQAVHTRQELIQGLLRLIVGLPGLNAHICHGQRESSNKERDRVGNMTRDGGMSLANAASVVGSQAQRASKPPWCGPCFPNESKELKPRVSNSE